MRDLRFVGLSEDGAHLLLVDENEQQLRLEIDNAVRAALRSVRRQSAGEPPTPAARPRDVQAFLRSGMTIAEVAERSGWTVEKVGLFEPPIRAERDHVAFTAQNLTVATRASAPVTVADRVNERLEQRGVVLADVEWDAFRTERGWSVVCRFPAGGRARVATWHFDAPTRSVHPSDDEARWLSEDDNSAGDSPLPAGIRAASPDVYDVIAEGGLENAARRRREPVHPGRIPHAVVRDDESPQPRESSASSEYSESSVSPTARTAHDAPTRSGPAASDDDADNASGTIGNVSNIPGQQEPVDLVSVMRERSRRRRSGSRRKPVAEERIKQTAAGTKIDKSDESNTSATPATSESDDASTTGTPDASGSTTASTSNTSNTASTSKESPGSNGSHGSTVNDLGHDPVTGTADLFGLDDVDYTPDTSESAATEPAATDSTTTESTTTQPECTEQKAPEPTTSGRSADRGTPDIKPSGEHATQERTETGIPDRPSQARKGRPAVPSWDDIMFGKRPTS